MQRHEQVNRQKGILMAICLGFIVVTDFLFYESQAGWNIGIFGLTILGGLLLSSKPTRLGQPVLRLTLLIAGLAFAAAIEPSFLVLVVGSTAVITLALALHVDWPRHPQDYLLRWWGFYTRGWRRFFKDLPLLVGRLTGLRTHIKSLHVWTLPLFLSAGFVILFAIANPVISHALSWVTDNFIAKVFNAFFELVRPARFFLWAWAAVWGWALLRPGIFCRRPYSYATPKTYLDGKRLIRCLILFNGIFLFQNALDLIYFVGGAALPEGMSYASYAHRGAYPLVATALLAALFVLLTFKEGGTAERSPLAKLLVIAWIAQNVVLTFTAGWRLVIYIDAYGLTGWRLATLIWLALVAFGLVTISGRIAFARSNSWLLAKNFSACLITLYLCCFPDFNLVIAWHNALTCREIRGTGTSIDLHYMERLGPSALPAVTWLLTHVSGTSQGFQVLNVQYRLRHHLSRSLQDWRGWTLLRGYLASQHLESEGGY